LSFFLSFTAIRISDLVAEYGSGKKPQSPFWSNDVVGHFSNYPIVIALKHDNFLKKPENVAITEVTPP